MPEMIQEFLSWYLAPWRRIGRKEFGIGLTVATLPGFLLILLGIGSGAGSFIAPLMDLTTLSQPVGNMELERHPVDVSVGTEQLKNVGFAPQIHNPFRSQPEVSAPTVPEAPRAFDWSGLISGLCLLLIVPLVRMRLRDMGWFGWHEMVITGVMSVSVVGSVIQSLTGYDVIPLGMLWSSLNFMGYLWLTLAKSQPRVPVHERIPSPWDDASQRNDMPAGKKDFPDEY